MNYQRLGSSGLNVSRICLGCMSYGDPDAALPGATLGWTWAMKEAESRHFFKPALELGINFFDTANVYSFGASEEITGGGSGRRVAPGRGDGGARGGVPPTCGGRAYMKRPGLCEPARRVTDPTPPRQDEACLRSSRR